MSKARDLANIISGSGTLNANVIPDLPTSKITSGTFADSRLSSSSITQHVDLSNLNADNLTSGSVPSARIGSAAVTQHVDLTSLSASNLTSGTVPSARLSLGESDIPTLTGNKISGGTFGSVNGSSLTSLPSSAPTNAQILSGVASVSAGSVGSYISMYIGSFSKFVNDTFSTNNAMYYCSFRGLPTISGGNQPSGTYRAMGEAQGSSNYGGGGTLFLRIS
jgi:hypothetical protein